MCFTVQIFSLDLGGCCLNLLWDELSPKWPKAYWDDWLRLKENHKGRQFIHPEVCRTYNFGEHDNYLKHFVDMVKKAKPVDGADAVLKAYNIDGDVRVHYKDQADFECIAHQFGIFEEWKDGVPRTTYKGVVVFRYQTQDVYSLLAQNLSNCLELNMLSNN